MSEQLRLDDRPGVLRGGEAGGPANAHPLRALYEEVIAHSLGCPSQATSLSDTWIQTLRHRGHVYEFDDMLRMLSPGNKVNFWIDDLHYLVDRTVLNLEDPIVRRLLEAGESDFGEPRKDLVINGRRFASNFIHYVGYAARIIHAIETRGLREPAILEIGGGLGGLASILRRYFGERMTLYLIDIPETLLIQEWYLRACFPDAATSYKATDERAGFQPGGINFINAYVLESQDVQFDVAINIDSMQEMTCQAAWAYLRYIERNISRAGFFYFQNHYGHSPSSVAEPSEYRLDGSWTIEAAEMAYQIDCCAESEQARFILARTPESESVETRTLILRLLWNGFVSGRLANSPALVEELSRLPRMCPPAAAVPEIGRILKRHGVAIAEELIVPLQASLYFPRDSFVPLYHVEPVPTREPKGLKQAHMEAVWRAQSEVLQLMGRVGPEGERWPAERIRARLHALCERHLLALDGTPHSEYWSGYVASLLMVLGERAAGKELLAACSERSSNPFWLTRFAYLLSRFGHIEEARRILRKAEEGADLEYYLALKCAELEAATGDPASSRRRLQGLWRQDGCDLPRLVTLARTAVRADALEVARAACRTIWERFPESRVANLLAVVKASPSGAAAEARAFIKALVGHPVPDGPIGDPAVYGALLIELGERDEGLSRLRRTIEGMMDYYRLGLAGRFLQEAGCDTLADACLERSLALRPDSFLHHDFVGNVYFGAARYAKARGQYERSLAIKPYLRHIQAKALYCVLPDAIRQAGVFGQPADLPLVFQRKQDFYHDLGLSNK